MAMSNSKKRTLEERQNIVARLFNCQDPQRRPGGGITFTEWTSSDLEKIMNKTL